MVINSDVISGNVPENEYCVSVRIAAQSEQNISIKVLGDDPGVKINPSDDPLDFTITHLRNGLYPDLWLLSGGFLLFSNDNFSLAMGERNHKSVDPCCWTNIISGRCDNYWRKHIVNELAEEWVAFGYVKRSKRWYRLQERLSRLPANPIPEMDKSLMLEIPSPYTERGVSIKIDQTGEFLSLNTYQFWKQIDIFWWDKTESFPGIVMVDEMNHTVEIRQPAVIDLSMYSEKRLFFPEGTGRADWFPLRELIYLRDKELSMEEKHFTPFIGFLLDQFRHQENALL